MLIRSADSLSMTLWPFKKVIFNNNYSINYWDWSQMHYLDEPRVWKDKMLIKPKSTNKKLSRFYLSQDYIQSYYYDFKETYMKYNIFYKKKTKIRYPWHLHERIVSNKYLFDWTIQIFYRKVGFSVYEQINWVRSVYVWPELRLLLRLIAGIPIYFIIMPLYLYLLNIIYGVIANFYVWKNDSKLL
jgi:hypothetical protein